MGDEIKFDRKPYTVTYTDMQGQVKTLRRVPPAKVHEALPTDIVTITHKRNDDFRAGDDVEVKHINPRNPNVLQVQNDEGQTTFLDVFDFSLKEEVAWRNGIDPRDRPGNSRYLLWP